MRGAEVALLSGHNGDVMAIAYRPDVKRLASAERDETVRLWNLKTGENLATLTGHEGLVTGVAFSSDRKQLVSGSGDATVRLWDAETGRFLPVSVDTPEVLRRWRSPRIVKLSSVGTAARLSSGIGKNLRKHRNNHSKGKMSL